MLTPHHYQEIYNQIRKAFRSCSIEQIMIDDRFDDFIDLTVIFLLSEVPFKIPEYWEGIPMSDSLFACIRSLPMEEFLEKQEKVVAA